MPLSNSDTSMQTQKNNKILHTIVKYILLYSNENREKRLKNNKVNTNSVNSVGYSSRILFSGHNKMQYLGIVTDNRANYTCISLKKTYH